MTEDRTSAQNVGPQDRTSSSGRPSPSPSPSSTSSLFISIVTSFLQLNICVRRRRSRRMVKIELVRVFRNRWLYIYVVNIWHSLQRKNPTEEWEALSYKMIPLMEDPNLQDQLEEERCRTPKHKRVGPCARWGQVDDDCGQQPRRRSAMLYSL